MAFDMGNGGLDRRPMSDINIIPLVDVVLVLLIIFMVTAPMMQTGLEMELPKVSATGIDISEAMLARLMDEEPGRIAELFLPEKGYPTPKVDLRAVEITLEVGHRALAEKVSPRVLFPPSSLRRDP